MRCKGHGEGKGAGAEQGREQLSRAEPEQQGQRPTATKRQGMKGREGGGTRISEFPDTQGDLGKQAHQVGGILLGSLSALGPPLLHETILIPTPPHDSRQGITVAPPVTGNNRLMDGDGGVRF